MEDENSNRAVVIGAGIAGLCAARILSNYFKRVMVVDRDSMPEEAVPRKGVPQSRHPHVMLARGKQELDEVFPGLDLELLKAGAETIDYARDTMMRTAEGWQMRFESDLKTISASRGLLERVIRRRLEADPRLEWLENAEVEGLRAASKYEGAKEARGQGQPQRVAGVEIRRREGSREKHFAGADLVVDCSGRNSAAPEWLAKLGFPLPRVERVDALVGYATRSYRRLPGVDWKVVLAGPIVPKVSRGVLICSIEGDRWLVTLVGINGDYPPTREEDFLPFLKSREIPEIYEVLARAEPLSGIVGARGGQNRFYHYEEQPQYPENFLLLGDAVFSPNPSYGQGMSLALMGARVLEKSLEAHPEAGAGRPGLASHFQKALFETLSPVWQNTAARDAVWPTCQTEGYAPPPAANAALVGNYMKELLKAAKSNQKVLEGFYRVGNLLEPGSYLFRPEIFLEVVGEMSSKSLIPTAPG